MLFQNDWKDFVESVSVLKVKNNKGHIEAHFPNGKFYQESCQNTTMWSAIDPWYHCLTSSEFLMGIWGIVDMYQVKAWAIYFILSL